MIEHSENVKTAVDEMNAEADAKEWTDEERATAAELFQRFQRECSMLAAKHVVDRRPQP